MSDGNRSFLTMLLAIFMMISFINLAGAKTILPGDIKITDGEIVKSLTGKAGDAVAGKKLYYNRKLGNCLACHANKDLGGQPFHGEIGPAIDGVADRYSEGQLRAIIVNSKLVFGEQTIMPAFYKFHNENRTRKEFHNKTIMNAQQIEDLIAYLKTLKE